MSPEALVALGVAAAAAAALAVYLKFRAAGDDGPIRVKGGSVTIDAEDDWVATPGQPFKLAHDNRRLTHLSLVVTLDGVPSGPFNGREVEVEVVEPTGSGGTTEQIDIKVANGVRVKSGKLRASGKVLTHDNAGAFMQNIRLRGGPPKDFGPFDAAQSKKLMVEIQPLE